MHDAQPLSWPQLQGKRQLQFISIRGLLDTQLQNWGHHGKPVDIVVIHGSWHAFPHPLQGSPCTASPTTRFGCSVASKSKVKAKRELPSIWHGHLGICMPTEEDLLIRLQGTNPKGPFIDPGGHQAKVSQLFSSTRNNCFAASLPPCLFQCLWTAAHSVQVVSSKEQPSEGRKTWNCHAGCNTFSQNQPFLGRKLGNPL